MSWEWSLALVCLTACILFWPRLGLATAWSRMREFSRRAMREDALKYLLKAEAAGGTGTSAGLAGALRISTARAVRLLGELEENGLLGFDGGKLQLTAAGAELGLQVVRAHRLWESHLAEKTGLKEEQWHRLAEKQEHLLSAEETDRIAAQLGHPTHDPHGDRIPAAGELVEPRERPSLNSLQPHAAAVITHIEDEPETVYRQLVAQGLRPGEKLVVLEKSHARVRFRATGREHVLPPVLAENISVEPLPGVQTDDIVEEEHLCDLKEGQTAKVAGVSGACRGMERRRLLDLGFVAGTAVEVEMVSPAGDPVAYRVRGTLVALRREQAELIAIRSRKVLPA